MGKVIRITENVLRRMIAEAINELDITADDFDKMGDQAYNKAKSSNDDTYSDRKLAQANRFKERAISGDEHNMGKVLQAKKDAADAARTKEMASVNQNVNGILRDKTFNNFTLNELLDYWAENYRNGNENIRNIEFALQAKLVKVIESDLQHHKGKFFPIAEEIAKKINADHKTKNKGSVYYQFTASSIRNCLIEAFNEFMISDVAGGFQNSNTKNSIASAVIRAQEIGDYTDAATINSFIFCFKNFAIHFIGRTPFVHDSQTKNIDFSATNRGVGDGEYDESNSGIFDPDSGIDDGYDAPENNFDDFDDDEELENETFDDAEDNEDNAVSVGGADGNRYREKLINIMSFLASGRFVDYGIDFGPRNTAVRKIALQIVQNQDEILSAAAYKEYEAEVRKTAVDKNKSGNISNWRGAAFTYFKQSVAQILGKTQETMQDTFWRLVCAKDEKNKAGFGEEIIKAYNAESRRLFDQMNEARKRKMKQLVKESVRRVIKNMLR